MNTVICLFCHVNSVPLGRWNMRCETCKAEQVKREAEEQRQVAIHGRMPASVLKPDGTTQTEVFVDKFGKEVQNPGYDLKNDKHGWQHTGKKPHPAVFIK